MLLAGDVGGTKTSLAMVSAEKGPRDPLVRKTYPSRQYPSLEALAAAFLQDVGLTADRASFGVAGPVVEGKAEITNLPWQIDAAVLQRALGVRSVTLLNDLEAIAYGVPRLHPDELVTLNEGRPVPHGAMGVVAPGTGLGEAYLTWEGGTYEVHASEGGHTDFGPTDDLQIGLLKYLLDRYGHVSYERICSGLGLPNIYAYLKESGYAPEPEWLAAELAAAADRTPVIVDTAMRRADCTLCTATLDIFADILAQEAGNLGLKVLATGGIYLGGGIPPRILSVLQRPSFMRSFTSKGRFATLLREFPVHVIVGMGEALFGAACYGLEESPS